MTASVKVRNIVFGEGIPKICVPLTGIDLEELKESTKAIQGAPFDFVEWRADFYKQIEDPSIRLEAMTFLRKQFGEIPILFTLRTSNEGGKLAITSEDYIKLNRSVIDSGLVDLVDVEFSMENGALQALVADAHLTEVKIVASFHDFVATPPKEIIVNHLCMMQKLGADIAKFAATPQSARDVLTLLDATLTMKEEHGDTPVITMSMAELGAISRVCGGVFGSSVSFGTVGSASAPGQLPAQLLSTFLQNLA